MTIIAANAAKFTLYSDSASVANNIASPCRKLYQTATGIVFGFTGQLGFTRDLAKARTFDEVLAAWEVTAKPASYYSEKPHYPWSAELIVSSRKHGTWCVQSLDGQTVTFMVETDVPDDIFVMGGWAAHYQRFELAQGKGRIEEFCSLISRVEGLDPASVGNLGMCQQMTANDD